MTIFFSIFIFVFGLLVGSFLNCLIYRLELKELKGERKSPLKGRSFCPSCKHVLSWYDLIPILSFFYLRGKCRYCGKKISIQYPLVELATALMFLLVFNSSMVQAIELNLLFLFYYLLITCFLIIIFVFDLKHFIIPDVVLFPAIVITFLYRVFFSERLSLSGFIFSALISGLFFLLIFLISRGKWLGFGDVKLVLFMGLFLGYPQILVGLFLSFFIGAIIGVMLMLLKKKGLKSEVPFGPFLVVGTYIGLFWGQQIYNWYLNLLMI